MYQYFTMNFFLSLLVLIYLYALKTAPFRVQFRLVMIVLLSWLLPYDLINVHATQSQLLASLPVINNLGTTIKSTIITQVNYFDYLSFVLVLQVLCVFGLIYFIKDLTALYKKQAQLNATAEFYKTAKNTPIYFIAKPKSAFSLGFIKPKIYLSKDYKNSDELNSILTHELNHITKHDHLWLLSINFIQRLLWWNPLVLYFSKKARNLMELSCDQACSEALGKDKYQYDLAQTIINNSQKNQNLALSFFGTKNFNIFRIKQLNQEHKMQQKHKFIIFSTAIIPLLLMVLVTTQSLATKILQDKEISFNFDKIPLKSVLELIFDANPKEVIGYENVPDISVSFEAWNVSVQKVEKLVLKCSGLKLVSRGKSFEIVKDNSFNNDFSQLNKCIQLPNKKEDVPQERVEMIKLRNAQFREYLKENGKEVPKQGELPFDET